MCKFRLSRLKFQGVEYFEKENTDNYGCDDISDDKHVQIVDSGGETLLRG